MDSLIETFHINKQLLLAQIINFAIVFGVLYYFALKPLMKIMQARTKKVEKSLEDAKKIEERLLSAEEEYKKIINNGKKEANSILEKANLQIEERKKEMINKTKEEIGQIINQEKAKMQAEKSSVLKEIKKDVAGLIATSLEKILGEKLDAKKDHELIKKIIK